MVEPALPEPGHPACPVDQRGKRAEPRAVIGLSPFMAVAYQPGLPQNAEVLRHRRLGDPGVGCQRAHRLFPVAAQPLEESPPGRVGERPEQRIVNVRHRGSITWRLWIYV